MTILQTVMGLVILLLGGDFLVRGAVASAQRIHVPALVIGLTVVAFGTSAPEFVVSVEAVLGGSSDIAVGNVVGSNIANVLLVIGVPSLLYPTACNSPMLRRNTVFALVVSAIFIAVALDGTISVWNGGILMVLLLVFIAYSAATDRRVPGVTQEVASEVEHHTYKGMTAAQIFLFISGGLAGLLSGAKLLVDGAIAIATAAEIPEPIIGLTLVAVGTSVPELATALVAAARRHSDVIVGTALGSCIFNLAGVMGATALITDVTVSSGFIRFDLWIMVGALALLTPFIFAHTAVRRWSGGIYLLAYGAYILALFLDYSAVNTSLD
jgi:cation:H+ antiporter